MFAESSPSLVAYWGQMTRRGMDQSVVHFSTLIRKRHHAVMSLIIYFVFPAISVNINFPQETTTTNIHYAQNDRLRSWKSDTDSQEKRRAQAETKAYSSA